MATPRITKIPLPMIEPTLKKSSAHMPIVRLSSLCPNSPSTGFSLNSEDAMVPPFRSAVRRWPLR